MGVKDLWEVLAPVARKVQLDDLRGKRLAVDLSGWIVESEQMRSKIHQPVIRNLFFRCNKLLGYGIKLVFVLEGTAPEVKEETLSQRNQARGGEGSKSNGGMLARRRPGLQAISSQCRELLDVLGLPYVQSTGEAEGTCAFLDKNGMVDGCITQDGDAFLYGAKTVYRKLCIEDKDPHVLSYKIADIENKLGLNREKLVALAVLAGCDYFTGVRSVGKETALKLLDKFGDTGSLERLRDWTRDSKYSKLQETLDRNCKKGSHCGNCQHPGTQKSHHAHGCIMCSTDTACAKSVVSNCTCDWHKAEAVKSQWRTELDVRKKALDEYDKFPPENVISEFLTDQDDIQSVDSCWQFPSAKKFEDFMYAKLGWGPEESREKLFPLLTRCHLERGGSSCEEVVTLKPVKIVKERVRRNADFYEVEWLATELWTQSSPPNTLEPQGLFEDVYPELVKAFHDEQNQKSKKKAVIPEGTNSDIRGYFNVTSGKSQQVFKDKSEGTGEKKLGNNAADIASKKSKASSSSKSRSVTTRMRKPKSSPPKTTETVDSYFVRSPKFSAKLDVSVDSSLDEFNVPLSQRIAAAIQKQAESQPTSSAGSVAPAKPGKSLEPVLVGTSKSDPILEESVVMMDEVLCRKTDNPVAEMTPNSSPDLAERTGSSSSITSLPEQKPTASVQEKLTTQPDDEASRSTSPTSVDLSKPAKSSVSADDGVVLTNISTTKEGACGSGIDSLKSSTQFEDSRKPSWPASFNLSLSDSLKKEFMTSMELSNGEDDVESGIGCTPPKRRNLSTRKSVTSASEISPDRLAGGDAGRVTSSSSAGPEGSPDRRISGRRRLWFNETVTSTPVHKQCSRGVEKVERLSEDVLASFESQGIKSVKLESEESYDHSGSLFDSRGESLELSEKNRQPSVIVISDDEDNC
ncbi:flap endonuclease GEN homolog 1 [Dermacentor silvarum]|uniref:flap endonuclease GEN homolog 1 n=1 Tax=Dermacentor silvarum TaxID=543639 RepID=UPI00189B9169|nr:flap endonuclease GEN homolog 1 [Dermacentor silvarum]